MATRKIIDAKHNGEKVWLKSHAQATYMSDGTTVEDAIKNISVPPAIDTTEYATKEELQGKQDLINDLETIRSGAAKGATALQPGDIPNSAEPMVCAYTIGSYTARTIALENHTYNGQTMDYREGAIISVLNPNSTDIVFVGGMVTLDGNEYETGAFTIKSGATVLFSLGPDSGVLLPVSSVVGATTSYVDEAIANAITNTLNTPV